jgi:peptidoglycan/LPS O-acetylase OafA/YrhL
VTLCSLLGFLAVPRSDLIQAATYTINYSPGFTHALYVRHIWSLAVEEQFYLLWPVALLLAGKRRGLIVAGAFLLAGPAIRLIYWFFVPSMHPVMDGRFEAVADALATGCVLAGIQPRLATRRRYSAALQSRWFFLLPVLTMAFAILVAPRPRTYYGAGITILNVAIAICIDRFVRYPAGLIGSVLNSGPFRTVGILSYSIYVWQQPFLVPHGTVVYQRTPYNLILVAIFSLLSYYVIERPMLRLGQRFRHRRGPEARTAVATRGRHLKARDNAG